MLFCRRLALCLLVAVLVFGVPVAADTPVETPSVGDGDSNIVLQTDAPEANETDAEDEDEDGDGSIEIDVDSGNASVDNESADSDGAGVDANAGGGGGGGMSAAYGGGGGGDDSSFVEDRLDDIKEWFMSTAADGSVEAYETLMEELNQLLYTLPAPGVPDDPMSWYTPDNGWWPDVMGLYWMFGSVSVGVLILAGGASFIVDDPSMSKGYLRLSVLGIFAILAGPLFIGAYLHFMNLLSLAVAPSGEEFLEGPENMAQLAAGSGLFYVLLKV